jgi:hypothetical protein
MEHYQYLIDNMQVLHHNIYIYITPGNVDYHRNYLPYYIQNIKYAFNFKSLDYLPLNCNVINIMSRCIYSGTLYNLPPQIITYSYYLSPLKKCRNKHNLKYRYSPTAGELITYECYDIIKNRISRSNCRKDMHNNIFYLIL